MIQHPFIDRVNEIQFLEKQYASKGPLFIVLYGRRRVGKTEILHQFLKQKPGIYFLATKGPNHQNINEFSKQCAVFLKDESFQRIKYDTWEDIFSSLFHHGNLSGFDQNNKIVIIFDEFPYLISADSAIPSLFQKVWDTGLSSLPVMIILSGSSISIMESDVLGYKSPLYGRRTGQWRVNPLSFRYIRDFLPWTFTDIDKAYSILGGIPAYLQKFDPIISFWENLSAICWKKDLIFTPKQNFF